MKTFRKFTYVSLLLGALTASAQAPSAYYDKCQGKSGEGLLSTLYDIVGPHTTISYDGLYGIYDDTDGDGSGKLIDMYSTKHWSNTKSEQCGTYKNVGDCFNREHSFPKSWFSEGSPMKSDAFHVVPTDGKVNNQRSNYPYGECAGGTKLASHNGVDPLGRLGTSTFPGYTGKVFEPDDEYKGDFARIYFYMAAAYYNRIRNWDSDMLAGNSYPAFSDWAVNLLLKWHRQDPVSQREIDRNEAVYKHQHNRNPFVDNPEMVEYVWGDKKNIAWYPASSYEPAIITPANGSVVDFGETGIGVPVTRSVRLHGKNLTGDITVMLDVESEEKGYTLSCGTFTAHELNDEQGALLNITLCSTEPGNKEGKIRLYYPNASGSHRVFLTGSVVDGIPTTGASDITETSFVANWVNIGDGDTYTLHVCQGDDDIQGFPVQVQAAQQSYLVEGLDPFTSYGYWLESANFKSKVVVVTTLDFVPSVQYQDNGEFVFDVEPGEDSQPQEVWIETENFDTDIYVHVDEPFQVSSEKNSEWGQLILITPEENRFFLRVAAAEAGEYETYIAVGNYKYSNTDGYAKAYVRSQTEPWFVEDFENPNEGKLDDYNFKVYEGKVASWNMDNMGIFAADGKADAHSGESAVRFGKRADSTMTTTSPKTSGIGIITFWSKKWTANEADATIEVEYSPDCEHWKSAGQASVVSEDYSLYTFTVNQAGDYFFRLRQSAGARLFVDDIVITDCTLGVDAVNADADDWTAYRTRGGLAIELSGPARTFFVYTMDGRAAAQLTLNPGSTTLSLPAGLYLVTDDHASRIVLVK